MSALPLIGRLNINGGLPVYKLNITKFHFKLQEYHRIATFVGMWEQLAESFFGSVDHHYAFNTYQFDDYGKYISDAFQNQRKQLIRRNIG